MVELQIAELIILAAVALALIVSFFVAWADAEGRAAFYRRKNFIDRILKL